MIELVHERAQLQVWQWWYI